MGGGKDADAQRNYKKLVIFMEVLSMNSVNLLGRLTAAPIPCCSDERLAAAFSLAVKRPYKDKNGEYGVDFIDCAAFGKLGVLALSYLTKGRLVCVSGRLEISKYVGSDGVSRQRCCVIADSIDFCESPKGDTPAVSSPADGLDYPPEFG